MAKLSSINTNNRRREMSERYKAQRQRLKKIIHDEKTSSEDKLSAVLKLASLPRNSAPSRVRNRCELTGRPRSYYRKFKMSRIALRSLASQGLIPGVTKASW